MKSNFLSNNKNINIYERRKEKWDLNRFLKKNDNSLKRKQE